MWKTTAAPSLMFFVAWFTIHYSLKNKIKFLKQLADMSAAFVHKQNFLVTFVLSDTFRKV